MGDYDQNLHAKILRSGQYIIESQKYVVNAPRVFRKTKEQEIDESSKRIEDLREEIRALEKELAEKFDKSQKESDEILEKAEQEAERIVKESEKSAFERVKKSLEEKEQSIQEYQQRANNIIDQANIEAGRIIQEARTESEKIKELSRAEAFQAGKDEGFQNGKMEIVSMTEASALHYQSNAGRA